MPNIRNLSSAILFLAACSAACIGQASSATFQTKTSVTGRMPSNIYAVDVNNDGVPDIIQDAAQQPNKFTVSIANGDGTFRAPVTFTFPTQYQGPIPMAWGDFNGDGKVDLIFELGGSNQLALFLGKGDGTFQAPKYITIALPSGQHFGGVQLLAADFSGDGKLDLVTEANTTSTDWIYLMKGDGTGNFGNPTAIYMPAANHGVGGLAIGDFDGDGKADVAFTDNYNCNQGGCSTVQHVLYNDGSSRFTDATSYSSNSAYDFATGDLNSDGRTDIFLQVNNSLVVLYGQASRTFHTYTMASPSLATLAMADFNGDGRMDLVGSYIPTPTSSAQLVFFLADTSPGTFTQQVYTTSTYPIITTPVVGNFDIADGNNSGVKPDIAFVGGTGAFNNATIVGAVNTTSSGNWGTICHYPYSGMGIRVCSPATSGPPTNEPLLFSASANSYGQLRKIELWVDEKKIGEQYHVWGQRAWFNLTDNNFTPGSHTAVLFVADVDNRLQKLVFGFNFVGACTAPTSPGVKICSPINGSTVSSPVSVEAVSTVSGTFARMELWVDGVKTYTQTSHNSLNLEVTETAGKHRFAVLTFNTTGQKWENAVYATVK